MYYNYEKKLIVPLNSNSKHSSIFPLLINNPLRPEPSQLMHFVFANKNLQLNNNKQLFKIDYKIHRGFTCEEEIFIRNAMEIVSNRLIKPEILENMYEICGISGCLFGTGVWSRSKLANDKTNHGIHDLLRFQLMCLQFKGEKNQFPTIHIYPMYEKTDTQAEGNIGCLACIYHTSTCSIEGKFKVKLNRYNLNISNEHPGNIVYWAGAIVHEMLHNLGHKHSINDYSDKWQINVFEKCFLYDGNYAP
ncbi:unnamed protein product [Adineta steineri]|uniref:Uncharacterized protein n=1 Tax=Adineta steineri TaxID=433720 RepID=A0A813WZK4_9BILA|nr:unnamed protein product [Adineta steineri]